MKIPCCLYILILFLAEGTTEEEAEEVSGGQQQKHQPARHLSRKLNRPRRQPLWDEHQQLDDSSSYDCCPDYWRDKFPAARSQREDNEAKADGVARERRHSRRRHIRWKSKRDQPPETPFGLANTTNSSPAESTEAAKNTGQVTASPLLGPEASPTTGRDESEHATHPVLLALLICLVVFVVSGLLLLLLNWHNRDDCEPKPSSFFCPPDIGRFPENVSEIDGCNCGSSQLRSERQPPPPANSDAANSSRKKCKSVKMDKRKKKPTKKKPSKEQLRTPRRISEAELREIQSRIACILRHQCAACNCCKCNALDNADKPKSRRFTFFRHKKKSAGLCVDTRCHENKIRCATNVCATSDAFGTDRYKDPSEHRSSFCQRSADLKIRQ